MAGRVLTPSGDALLGKKQKVRQLPSPSLHLSSRIGFHKPRRLPGRSGPSAHAREIHRWVYHDPDDELLASGLLAELAARGREFHFASLTRGEGGITGAAEPDIPRDRRSSDRLDTSGCRPSDQNPQESLGRLGEAELRASAAALGASSVTFLNHLDPPGKPHRAYAPDVSVEELAAREACHHYPAAIVA